MADEFTSGVLSHVQFINCSGTNRLISMADPVDWIIEDVYFYNCSSSQYLLIAAVSHASVITFGGNITIDNAEAQSEVINPAVLFDHSSSFPAEETFVLRSNPSNPARWYFIGPDRAGFNFIIHSGHATFEAQSFQVGSPEIHSAFSFMVPQISESCSFIATVHEDLSVDGYGLLATSGAGQTSILVGGKIVCSSSTTAAILQVGGPTFISTSDIWFTDRPKLTPTWYVYNNLIMKVSNDFLMGTPPGSSIRHWMRLTNAYIDIEVGRTFNWTNVHLSFRYSDISISAENIVFERCFANNGNGGALELSDNAVLSLSASQKILFKGNNATNGGAISAVSSADFTLSGNVIFDSNVAELNGGAAYIYPHQVGALSTSSFFSNEATNGEGCAVYFVDSCDRFTTSGTLGYNLQFQKDPISLNCSYDSAMCTTFIPQTSCSTPQPSTGTWECVNNQWTLLGSLVAGTLTIPASTVVVVGSLTLSNDLVLTGLQSSVSVQGGCTYIGGTLQIELTAAELEEISKESGSSRTLSLISQDSSCPSLSSVAINVYKTTSSCRNVEISSNADVMHGYRVSLMALFKVNSSRCNTKWIILGCVLGGILVIVLVITLIVTFNGRAKAVFRPFWARDQTKRTGGLDS
jgi:predicted outer membrane repeat protein